MVDPREGGGYEGAVKRVELGEIRTCRRCGRGRATLLAEDGTPIPIPLDPARARVLSTPITEQQVRWLPALALELLQQSGAVVSEIVLDVDAGALRALVSCRRGAEVEVLACTPQEGVEIASRDGIALYATDEALAHVAGAEPRTEPETLH